MKVIGLMPVRNEEWILDITIPQLKRYVDHIICLDAGSIDRTIEILKSYDVEVIDGKSFQNDYGKSRQVLLEKGRENLGTHFVWLDADEAFTSNFHNTFYERLKSMKPGQKLALQWLCLWKDVSKYRDDNSVWSNLYKDFVQCDDLSFSFENSAKLHEGRTPGPNENTWLTIPKEEGAVLHFQFVSFERFQMKQAFQRCREYTLNPHDPEKINEKYSITLDDQNAKCKKIPQEWLTSFTDLEKLAKADVGWYYSEIGKFFTDQSINFYEPLQIWHIPALFDEFISKNGRKPIHAFYNTPTDLSLYQKAKMWVSGRTNRLVLVLRKFLGVNN